MSGRDLILASSSPRRSHFLKQLGIRFRKRAPDVDESVRDGESARRYVKRLAIEKAQVISAQVPDAWVLGADTSVVIDDDILGKPSDAAEARRMLRRLSGCRHRVVSGMALVRGRPARMASAVSSTSVWFRELSPKEIRWYVDTGEPMDKAGAYGLQGIGAFLIARIDGSYSNVAGFPTEKFMELLAETGIPFPAR